MVEGYWFNDMSYEFLNVIILGPEIMCLNFQVLMPALWHENLKNLFMFGTNDFYNCFSIGSHFYQKSETFYVIQ